MTLDDIVQALAELRVTTHHMRVGSSDVWILCGPRGRQLSAEIGKISLNQKEET